MSKKVLQFIREAGAASEEDTERDGFLSHDGETHGLVVGFYHGFIDFRDWRGLPDDIDGKNIENNWYTKGGYVAGAIVRVSIYLLLGAVAFGPFM